ncbi:hypothetical protein W97_07074 [Coniosporium apollinis CBS 100218]|uniref:DAGKc domain-containing protein n=1 Tax=Coniosporium apollinis (strain CBS 100218) TaxID=1168221 RepID=R7Z1A2_CONA1|nr:uncharacterized protein W97_07074 [Coniosporium apollinis CBS 100218]EON67819.1 hypothetical protein W97_07074 [Coniosporium apollinis CBS 100218]
MGATPSKDSQWTGEVDGKRVEFTYDRDKDQKQLRYRYKKSGRHVKIDGDNIIGLFSVPRGGVSASSLLYVKGANQPPDGKNDQQVPTFRSLVATGLPEDFIQNFRIDTKLLDLQQEAVAQSTDTPNIHVIVSTLSGTGLAKGFFQDVVRHVLGHIGFREGKDYLVHHTRSSTTVTEIATSVFLPRANDGVPQHIILLSGDGGVLDTINALLSRPQSPAYVAPVVALLPMGTGNALAHSLGISRDHTLGLATFARGTPKPLPLFRAAFSPGARLLVDESRREERLHSEDGTPVLYGAVVCSWGFHAGLVADSDTVEYRKYGAERFQMAAKAALFPEDGSPPHRYRAKVSVLRKSADGGEKWEVLEREEHMYVLTTLVSSLEKGFTVSPDSKPLDGRLRLVHFGPMGGEEVMRVMGLAYQGGGHVKEEAVGYEDIEGMRIDFEGREDDPRWRRICVDGKIIRVEKDGWVEVRKDPRHVLDILNISS